MCPNTVSMKSVALLTIDTEILINYPSFGVETRRPVELLFYRPFHIQQRRLEPGLQLRASLSAVKTLVQQSYN
jgi:hypothetical protein